MSDEALRDLERAALDEGTDAARLRYALALERIGRVDDAVIAAMPARASAEARALLARLRPGGTEPETRFFDVRPVEREPRVLWSRRVGSEGEGEWPPELAASPLGIAVQVRAEPLHVLDPMTGAELWRAEAGPDVEAGARLLATRDVLVRIAPDEGARAWDLASGVELWREPLVGFETQALTARPAAVVADDAEGRIALVDLDDPRRGLGPPRTYPSARLGPSKFVSATRNAVLTGQGLVGARALDRASGALLWEDDECYAALGDDAGFLVAAFGETGLVARAPDGSVLWRREGTYYPDALGAAFVVATRDGRTVQVLERATGAVLGELPAAAVSWPIVVRDVIVHVTGEQPARLRAFRATSELWSVELPGWSGEGRVAALDAGLVVVGASGEVTAFG